MDTAVEAPKLLTTDQAATHMNIKPQTLIIWRSTKRYPLPFIRVGRSIRYRVEDLDRWLESRTVGQLDTEE